MLNQIIDVDLDKINKPNLPLASGSLSLTHARKIVALSLTLSLLSAFTGGWILGVLILVICIIGLLTQYLPYNQKHHLPAAIAITGVKGYPGQSGYVSSFCLQ
ncbi:MAG: UbiA family prenyltransferase, partial [Saprospiraceae bacterium]|nr:UbiA family prenyltransferase [Saprospiraceae bacterium]